MLPNKLFLSISTIGLSLRFGSCLMNLSIVNVLSLILCELLVVSLAKLGISLVVPLIIVTPSSNAPSAKFVTLSGILILVSCVLVNAKCPIVVTLLGIVALARGEAANA